LTTYLVPGKVSDVREERQRGEEMSDNEILIQAAEILYQLRDGERVSEETTDELDRAIEILTDEVKDNW
jgi:hypothetical protein